MVLEYTVTKSGSVVDPVVKEAKPPGLFDRAAINAVLKYKYKPKTVSGMAIDVTGVREKIEFKLSD